MKKVFLILNILMILSIMSIILMSYLAVTHPFLTVLTGFVGINLVVFTLFKLG